MLTLSLWIIQRPACAPFELKHIYLFNKSPPFHTLAAVCHSGWMEWIHQSNVSYLFSLNVWWRFEVEVFWVGKKVMALLIFYIYLTAWANLEGQVLYVSVVHKRNLAPQRIVYFYMLPQYPFIIIMRMPWTYYWTDPSRDWQGLRVLHSYAIDAGFLYQSDLETWYLFKCTVLLLYSCIW